MADRQPLLASANGWTHDQTHVTTLKRTLALLKFLVLVGFVVALVFILGPRLAREGDRYQRLPNDPTEAAKVILSNMGVIDGHIDLPEAVRVLYKNNYTSIDMNGPVRGHVDIPRLREGKVGGFFWSAYVACPPDEKASSDSNFTAPSWRVRDTLEQIDVARSLIERYPNTFELVTSSEGIKRALDKRKIASLIGVEGGHQLGNSLGVLRTYHALGVRYLTLTHSCHNAFADSASIFISPPPLHGGLSSFGRVLIREMNRLGVLVDLSHTSDSTARQALQLSEAPVIFSHSSARAVHNVSRNVPDDILELIGEGRGKKDAVVMVNFAPFFVAPPGEADIKAVANHVEHIAKIAGKRHVGIGSDFDGIATVPKGLEDTSKYPNLFAELYKRGWKPTELEGLAGRNLLRVFQGAEETSRKLKASGMEPAMEIYEYRTDL